MAETKVTRRNTIRSVTYDTVLIAMFAALMAVCAWITVPSPIIGGVPFTLQTFALFASIGLLGTRRSFTAVLVYIVIGAIGVPVFSNFRGGFSVLIGTTGGYILGFLVSTIVSGFFIARFGKKVLPLAIGMALGAIAYYIFGTAQYCLVWMHGGGEASVVAALTKCVIPFLIPDALKIALAIVLTKALDGKVKIAK